MPYLINMCPKDFEKAINEQLPLLVPVGSVEFHGSQLPFGTDLFITEGICREIEKRVPTVVAPSFTFSPTGYAVSGPDKGTVDIDVDIFMNHCYEILKNYKAMGFKKIIVVVHHQGGNIAKLIETQIMKLNLYNTYKEAGVSWWSEKRKVNNCSISVLPATLDTGAFPGHGGKGETEAIMAVLPQLVQMDNFKNNDPFWNENAKESNKENADKQLEEVINAWIEKLS